MQSARLTHLPVWAVKNLTKKITFKLDARSINKAIKEVEAYMAKLKRIEKSICEELAKIGLQEARVLFGNAQYDGEKDADVNLKPTESGYRIVASGKTVAFIEFGTGVHYNRGFSYPIAKPSGIVGIGEYGKKQGRKDEWKYYSEHAGTNGVLKKSESTGKSYVITHGNPAQMPMYKALVKMQEEAERVVREAFKNA